MFHGCIDGPQEIENNGTRNTSQNNKSKKRKKRDVNKKQRNNPQPVILHVTQIAKEQNV